MLFDPFALRSIPLQNRIVMAPMTRNRAVDNIPTALMAEYYGQRASLGLQITEGVSPSPNGLGTPGFPGSSTLPRCVVGNSLRTPSTQKVARSLFS